VSTEFTSAYRTFLPAAMRAFTRISSSAL
jgi:hypothetical protein